MPIAVALAVALPTSFIFHVPADWQVVRDVLWAPAGSWVALVVPMVLATLWLRHQWWVPLTLVATIAIRLALLPLIGCYPEAGPHGRACSDMDGLAILIIDGPLLFGAILGAAIGSIRHAFQRDRAASQQWEEV